MPAPEQNPMNRNPIDPNTRLLLIGTALVGAGVAIASIFVAKKAVASTGAVSLDASDANGTQNLVSVGNTVTISLEADSSAGYGYPTPTVTPSGILSASSRSTTSSGISDTFAVLAAGTATVTYNESTPNGISTPQVFTIVAS